MDGHVLICGPERGSEWRKSLRFVSGSQESLRDGRTLCEFADRRNGTIYRVISTHVPHPTTGRWIYVTDWYVPEATFIKHKERYEMTDTKKTTAKKKTATSKKTATKRVVPMLTAKGFTAYSVNEAIRAIAGISEPRISGQAAKFVVMELGGQEPGSSTVNNMMSRGRWTPERVDAEYAEKKDAKLRDKRTREHSHRAFSATQQKRVISLVTKFEAAKAAEKAAAKEAKKAAAKEAAAKATSKIEKKVAATKKRVTKKPAAKKATTKKKAAAKKTAA